MFYVSRMTGNYTVMLLSTVITVCLLACSVLCGPVRDGPEDIFRLEDHIKPVSYKIELTLDENFVEILGHVKISTKLVNDWTDSTEDKFIYLHKAQSIKVTSLEVKNSAGALLTEEGDIGDEKTNEILRIRINDVPKIEVNDDVEIDIEYEINVDAATGLRKILYVDEVESKLLVTHFQPTYARSVFPCFDEPKFQATFELTVKNLPEKYKVLSNTDNHPQDNNEVSFERTPKMSTYMLAFIMYHEDSFGKKSDQSNTEEIAFNTWGRQSQLEEAADFGRDYGSILVNEMEAYTKIAYDGTSKSEGTSEARQDGVVEKLDQVAIPGYQKEPMETFGLATYDESTLLVKSTAHKKVAKDQAIKTIAYGVAHHWFGDLVTSEWWDSAWLNEGFSTFFDYHLTETAIPDDDWRMKERLVVEEQMKALEADAYVDSPPLSADPASNEDILKQIGVIASSKGASVLRMFENVVGEDFKVAVQNYLKDQLPDGVANQNALFEKLATVEVPKEYFEKWTEKKGFPLVKVTKSKEAQGEGKEIVEGIKFTQGRFLLDGTELDRDVTYNLRLKILTNAEQEEESELRNQIIFDGKEKFVPANTDNDMWILIKTDGYFRVNYEDSNWKLLAEHLKHLLAENSKNSKAKENDIDPLERAVLVDNALYLAKEGVLNYTYALDFVSFLEQEDDYIPWAAAIPHLDYLHRMLAKSATTREETYTIDTFIAKITKGVYKKLTTLSPEKHIDKIHYTKIQNVTCRSGNEECLQQAENKFASYLSGEVKDEDLRSSAYCYGVRNNSDNWNELWKILTGIEEGGSGSSTDPDDSKQSRAEVIGEERSDIMSALGCSISPEKLEIYLQETIAETDPAFSKEEIPIVFSSVYRNVDGIDVTLKFLKENIDQLEQKDKKATEFIIRDMAKYLKTDQHKTLLKDIKNASGLEAAIFEAALREVEQNKDWLNKYEGDITEALNCIFTDCTGTGPLSAKPAMLLLLASFFAAFIFL